MLRAVATLKSAAPYSQSKCHFTPHEPGETEDAYRQRTWREHLHVMEDGEVFIPPMAFKNALVEMCRFAGESVPGKGKATWTKHFDAGLQIVDEIRTGVKAADVLPERLFLPSDGRRGGGKRVLKLYPVIRRWSGTLIMYLIDETLCDEKGLAKVEDFLRRAGVFIGIGRWRPRVGGINGRWSVESFEVDDKIDGMGV